MFFCWSHSSIYWYKTSFLLAFISKYQSFNIITAVNLINFHKFLLYSIVNNLFFKVTLLKISSLQLCICHYFAWFIVPILIFYEFRYDITCVLIYLFQRFRIDIKLFRKMLIRSMSITWRFIRFYVIVDSHCFSPFNLRITFNKTTKIFIKLLSWLCYVLLSFKVHK